MFVTLREIEKDTKKYVDQDITVEGWVKTNRNQKQFGFIQFTDGTFFTPLQILYADSLANFDMISKLGVASAIKVSGKLVPAPKAKQAYELQATSVEVIAEAPSDYPLQPKRHSREYLREIAHLRPRTNLFQAVFRVRSLAAYAIHQFFQERDFVYVNTPIITASDAEGAGETFTITTLNLDQTHVDAQGDIDYSDDFFGKKAHLAVTGQLEGEAFALAFRNIYTFGPTFRAEHSHTSRHAAEFWMVEPEMAFANLAVNMDYAEMMIKFIVKNILEQAATEMKFLNEFVDQTLLERLQILLDNDFPRVTYTEAIEILQKSGKKFDNQVVWGIDLASEHERYLTDEVYKKPLFLINYPTAIKAFYMQLNDEDDGKTVAAMDLLVPGIGELIGGSAREHRLDKLTAKMKQFDIDMKELQWYLELQQYGGVPHAGFGLGFERLIMYLTGVENIRDVIPFPRTPNNLEF